MEEVEFIPERQNPNQIRYGNAYKRMRIEELFDELSLSEKPASKIDNGTSFKQLEGAYQDSQCFSIEIHKVPEYRECDEGDVLPRKRKLPKNRRKSRKNSENKTFENFSMSTSETGSSKKSPVSDCELNFSETLKAMGEINNAYLNKS